MMKKVLMCKPYHFRVDYSINPWMKIGSVDSNNAQIQWQQLVQAYQDLNVNIEFIDQVDSLPDMVFAADQGVLAADHTILLSNFRYPERRGENKLYHQWYLDHGYKVLTLPDNLYFEGYGELQTWRDLAFIGTGFRTTKDGASAVGKILGKEVLALELIDDRHYHLDTCFMVLNQDTVFYYPKAFSDHSITALKSLVPNLLELDDHDVANFASNSVVIDSTVIMQIGSINLPKQLNSLGYQVVKVDLSEFIKAGGGAHCLTGYLCN